MSTIQDRLIILAATQKSMVEVTNKLNKWDNSQICIENSAYESMNTSDEVLILCKEGNQLVGKLLECCSSMMKNPGVEQCKKTEVVLEDLLKVFMRITQSSNNINELAHRIEMETATQKVMEDSIMESLQSIGNSIDEVVASTELYLATCDNH